MSPELTTADLAAAASAREREAALHDNPLRHPLDDQNVAMYSDDQLRDPRLCYCPELSPRATRSSSS